MKTKHPKTNLTKQVTKALRAAGVRIGTKTRGCIAIRDKHLPKNTLQVQVSTRGVRLAYWTPMAEFKNTSESTSFDRCIKRIHRFHRKAYRDYGLTK